MKHDYKVTTINNAPSDVRILFSKLVKLDGIGVLSIAGNKVYKQIKSRGYWVSNTCGEVKLNKLTDKQKERIEYRRNNPSVSFSISMAFDRY